MRASSDRRLHARRGVLVRRRVYHLAVVARAARAPRVFPREGRETRVRDEKRATTRRAGKRRHKIEIQIDVRVLVLLRDAQQRHGHDARVARRGRGRDGRGRDERSLIRPSPPPPRAPRRSTRRAPAPRRHLRRSAPRRHLARLSASRRSAPPSTSPRGPRRISPRARHRSPPTRPRVASRRAPREVPPTTHRRVSHRYPRDFPPREASRRRRTRRVGTRLPIESDVVSIAPRRRRRAQRRGGCGGDDAVDDGVEREDVGGIDARRRAVVSARRARAGESLRAWRRASGGIAGRDRKMTRRRRRRRRAGRRGRRRGR